MNLIFSLDDNYAKPLATLIKSLIINHPEDIFHFHLLYTQMSQVNIEALSQLAHQGGHQLTSYDCQPYIGDLDNAYVNRYYSLDMYTWLFAPFILDEEIERALYLDPDIINLNSVHALYNLDLSGKAFAACAYDYKTKPIQLINNLRLGNLGSRNYFNTGVVLMDLPAIRNMSQADQIIDAINKKEKVLYLPDQDIFNFLFVDVTYKVDWQIYNLDPRAYDALSKVRPLEYHEDWVEDQVVFIHYCGKHKPFKEYEEYPYELGHYYFKYEEALIESKE